MEPILRGLGLSHLLEKFNSEEITPEAAVLLSPEQLTQLGIVQLGKQALLKERASQVSNTVRRTISIAAERRRLFQDQPSHSRSTSVSMVHNNGKRRRAKSGKTCNIKVFCLSQRDSDRVPAIFTQSCLRQVGLGEKVITFPQNASPQEVQDLILESFPKLKEGGGFEFLKATNTDRKFMQLPLQVGGFTAKCLKDHIRQSRVYVHPIQADLDITDDVTDADLENDDIKVACQTCGQMFGQTKLRSHIQTKHQGNDDNVDEDLVDPGFRRHETPQQVEDVATTSVTPEVTRDAAGSASSSPVTTGTAPARPVRHRNDLPTCSNVPEINSYIEYANLMDTVEPIAISEASNIDDDIDESIIEENLRVFDSTDEAIEAKVQEIIGDFQKKKKQNKDESVTVVIRRSKLVKTAITATEHKRASFFIKEPIILFSGEDATDLGGPKREFFRILMDQLPKFNVFEGKSPNLYFCHDSDLLRLERYRLAGRVLSWSLLHGGPAFPHFHPALLEMMFTGTTKEKFAISDVGDFEVAEKLQKIKGCSLQQELDDVVEDVGDWAADRGCARVYTMTIDEK